MSSMRMPTIMSGFQEAGLCPFNCEVVSKSKALPPLQFSSQNLGAPVTVAQSTQLNPVAVFDSSIGEEKVKKFEEWFEKYDIESDKVYSVWL